MGKFDTTSGIGKLFLNRKAVFNFEMFNSNTREISMQEEGDSIAGAVFNQLWAMLFYNQDRYFFVEPNSQFYNTSLIPI